jgi:hypothetical protein
MNPSRAQTEQEGMYSFLHSRQMYDIFTTAYLFFLLCPGVVLSLGTGMTAAAIHAVVFFLILQYVSLYIPWWAVWVVGISFVSYKVYSGGV